MVSLKIAYADPPYIGQAKRHYSDDPMCAEVDHGLLISAMTNTFDRWALSCSRKSLKYILSLCPDDVEVMPWVKEFYGWKRVRVQYAWEPVIFYGLDNTLYDDSTQVRDWICANMTTRQGVHGAKPTKFCNWILDILNPGPNDEFDDLYPGSGAITRAWERRRNQKTFEVLA